MLPYGAAGDSMRGTEESSNNQSGKIDVGLPEYKLSVASKTIKE